jgi:hypothetical protein
MTCLLLQVQKQSQRQQQQRCQQRSTALTPWQLTMLWMLCLVCCWQEGREWLAPLQGRQRLAVLSLHKKEVVMWTTTSSSSSKP